MEEKIILDCSKCGGTLKITKDTDLFKCEFCGTPYMVKREDGGIRIIKLEEKVEEIKDAIGALKDIDQVKTEQKEYENPTERYTKLFGLILVLAIIGICSYSLGLEFSIDFGIVTIGLAIILLLALPFMIKSDRKRKNELDQEYSNLDSKIEKAKQK